MYTYDNLTSGGVHIHLSMSENKESNYIFVHHIYTGTFVMKYFVHVDEAIKFIHSINPNED